MRHLVIAVHPDDETLGAGGTLLRRKSEGDEIFWIIISALKDVELQKKQDIVINKVAGLYGFDDMFWLRLPSMELDGIGVGDIVGRISDIVRKVRPQLVYIPWGADIHSDHRIVYEASVSLVKSYRFDFIKGLLAMEVLSETDFGMFLGDNSFSPNYFVDISEWMDKKKEILSVYESEIAEHPFPRSLDAVESLGKLRGAMIGRRYAEGFKVIKMWE